MGARHRGPVILQVGFNFDLLVEFVFHLTAPFA
jgi:hypothetical protein